MGSRIYTKIEIGGNIPRLLNQALDIIEKKIRSLFPPEVPDLPNFIIHDE